MRKRCLSRATLPTFCLSCAASWSCYRRGPHAAHRFAAALASPGPLPRNKVGKSAIAIIPPVSVWDRIQEVRIENDKSFYRWMPHINVLFPFFEDQGSSLEEAAKEATAALRDLEPFKVSLKKFMLFEHGRNSSTVWLNPAHDKQTGAKFAALHSSLLRAFPECTDLSDNPGRGITRFTPHLSLGGWRGRAAAEEAIESLGPGWEPVDFRVDRVCLISRRRFGDAFRVRWEAPLGGGGGPVRTDATYGAAPPARRAALGSSGGKDSWKQPFARPAADYFTKVNMKGRPWGLFSDA